MFFEVIEIARRVLELQRLRDDHLDAVLVFELENRSYFGRFVTDRGDGFYHRAPLAEQDAGGCVFCVLVDDDDGTIVGRFNLYDLADGVARVGYRVSERVPGRGVATSGGAAWTAVVSAALINLRFFPMALSAAPALRGGRIQRALESQADRGRLVGAGPPRRGSL